MRLYPRGKIWWADFSAHGQRHRLSTGQTTRRAAQATAEGWITQAKLGSLPGLTPQAAGRLTLGDAFDLWFAARIAGRRSQREYARAIETVLQVIPESTPVEGLSPTVIEQAVRLVAAMPVTHHGNAKLPVQRARSPATVNRLVVDHALRPMLSWVGHTQELKGLHKIKWSMLRLEEPPGRAPRFTAAQLAGAREALPPWHRPIFDFMMRYGPRLREAWFPLDAWDPETGTWSRPAGSRKTKEPLTIRLLPADATAMTARWSRARQAGLAHVWFKEGRRSLQPLTPQSFYEALDKAWAKSGLHDVRTVHDLRHHAGSEFQRLKGDLIATKRLLGHASILSTQRYAHHHTDSLFAAMADAFDTPATDASSNGTIAAQSAEASEKSA